MPAFDQRGAAVTRVDFAGRPAGPASGPSAGIAAGRAAGFDVVRITGAEQTAELVRKALAG